MIISFYSYKGGVGRSQLCANVAAYLCHKKGKRILLWDWDFEAPGLHYFFGKKNGDIKFGGTIELFMAYCKQIRSERNITTDKLKFFNKEEIVRLRDGQAISDGQSGYIDLIPAGNYNVDFIYKVNSFNWFEFYEVLDGVTYVDELRSWINTLEYDYIFIDSRTGITDYSGICNIQLPDANVVVAVPNEQNLYGSKQVVSQILNHEYTKSEARKPYVFPILSRIDKGNPNYELWLRRFDEEFSYLLRTLAPNVPDQFQKQIFNDSYLTRTILEYVPAYSTGENLLVNSYDQNISQSSFIANYVNIAEYIDNVSTGDNIEILAQVSREAWVKYGNHAEAIERDLPKAALAFTFSKDYDKANSLGGTFESWFEVGNARLNRGNFNEAIACYEKASKFEDDRFQLWLMWGYASFNLGSIEEAIIYFKKSADENKNDSEARYCLGHAYEELGRIDEAKFYYAEASRIAPEKTHGWRKFNYTSLQESSIKGLMAFGFNDKNIFKNLERSTEINGLRTALLDNGERLVILIGESGAGKTSFLRAGLTPAIQDNGYHCVVVAFSNLLPVVAIGNAIQQQIGIDIDEKLDFSKLVFELNPKLQGKAIVLVFDQFEQFFTQNPTEESQHSFVDQLDFVYKNFPSIRILLSIRSDFSGFLFGIMERTGLNFSASSNYFTLRKFKPEQIVNIINYIAASESIREEDFDRDFVHQLVDNELSKSKDGLISAADLQILLMSLKGKQTLKFTRDSFERIGGTPKLLQQFIEEQLKLPNTFNRNDEILLTLIASIDATANVRAGQLTMEEFERRLNNSIDIKFLPQILTWLDQNRLFNKIEELNRPPKYELAHERLVEPIRALENEAELDNFKIARLIEKRTSEWLSNNRSSRYLLSWGEIYTIYKSGKSKEFESHEGERWQYWLSSKKRMLRQILAVAGIVSLFVACGLVYNTAFYRMEFAWMDQQINIIKQINSIGVEPEGFRDIDENNISRNNPDTFFDDPTSEDGANDLVVQEFLDEKQIELTLIDSMLNVSKSSAIELIRDLPGKLRSKAEYRVIAWGVSRDSSENSLNELGIVADSVADIAPKMASYLLLLQRSTLPRQNEKFRIKAMNLLKSVNDTLWSYRNATLIALTRHTLNIDDRESLLKATENSIVNCKGDTSDKISALSELSFLTSSESSKQRLFDQSLKLAGISTQTVNDWELRASRLLLVLSGSYGKNRSRQVIAIIRRFMPVPSSSNYYLEIFRKTQDEDLENELFVKYLRDIRLVKDQSRLQYEKRLSTRLLGSFTPTIASMKLALESGVFDNQELLFRLLNRPSEPQSERQRVLDFVMDEASRSGSISDRIYLYHALLGKVTEQRSIDRIARLAYMDMSKLESTKIFRFSGATFFDLLDRFKPKEKILSIDRLLSGIESYPDSAKFSHEDDPSFTKYLFLYLKKQNQLDKYSERFFKLTNAGALPYGLDVQIELADSCRRDKLSALFVNQIVSSKDRLIGVNDEALVRVLVSLDRKPLRDSLMKKIMNSAQLLKFQEKLTFLVPFAEEMSKNKVESDSTEKIYGFAISALDSLKDDFSLRLTRIIGITQSLVRSYPAGSEVLLNAIRKTIRKDDRFYSIPQRDASKLCLAKLYIHHKMYYRAYTTIQSIESNTLGKGFAMIGLLDAWQKR